MSTTYSQIKFKKIRGIGNNQGKNSQVFVARDLQMDTELFIKKVKKEDLKNQGLKMDDYFLEARMLYEGKHPNIAEIQYASEDMENIYLAMPIYENGSLSSKMDDNYLTVREIIKYSLEILSGISYIHSKQMVHLDIKPTNILIDDTGRARVTDFGLSRFLNEYGFAQQDISYIYHTDPEIYKSTNRSILSDIYQFGLLLYRMCNGNSILKEQIELFNITTKDSLKEYILSGNFPDRKSYLPHVPTQLQKIIKKCINVDLEKRYTNTIDIMNDISSITECLDWRYSPSSKRIYEKVMENKKIAIEIEEHNNKYSIICSNEGLDGNNSRKTNKYCYTNLSEYNVVLEKIKGIIKDIS
ncbi:serine/Threonine protein kinase [[Clostridium] sordellii]|uniref:serine/threonine-protein kinase n=1 Tax=Paraclostridium sordellii TaxID=1505 RepID=UPI0005E38B32|nr:serine/threonine-protein kinase [Paeniclostridium sordellii]CEQ06504.1 serine/Threonine protein kinase [[Clostridium] sordellii] [Paeniclostridium sordellii]